MAMDDTNHPRQPGPLVLLLFQKRGHLLIDLAFWAIGILAGFLLVYFAR